MNMKKIVVMIAAGLLAAGCVKRKIVKEIVTQIIKEPCAPCVERSPLDPPSDVKATQEEPTPEPWRPGEESPPVDESVPADENQAALPEFEPIHFAFDSAKLLPPAREYLARVVEAYNLDPGMSIILTGHADRQGPAGYNYTLGLRRAYSVKYFLKARGIPQEKIAVGSLGNVRPVCGEWKIACHAQNRRVEIETTR